jgi:probable HAF family extracellular repeat protein
MIRKICLVALCIHVLAATSTMAATAAFQGLGDLSGGSFSSLALDVSNDGSVVVGYGTTASGQQAFRWTQSTGMVALGSFTASSASKVSADGATIVGGGDSKAFRWTQAGGMEIIPGLSGATSSDAGGVSADGSVVAGTSGGQAFRWTQSGGTVGLGYLSGKTSSSTYSVSDDGSVVVGASGGQAFRWTQSGGMQGLGYLPGDSSDGWAHNVSPDGSVIVGTSGSMHAFRWTASTGTVALGSLSGMNVTHPLAASNYGSKIVGASYNNSTYLCYAFIWDSAHGMRNLKSVLQSDYGLTLTGWTLNAAYGISADGNVIVGQGTNPSGQTEAFRVILVPEPSSIALITMGGLCLLWRCASSPLKKCAAGSASAENITISRHWHSQWHS